MDDDVRIPQLGAGRDIDRRVRLTGQPANILQRLVQIALVQLAAGTRRHRRTPPADGVFAFDAGYAPRHIAQRQFARRQ
ncbi:hypothetical protein D3C78_1426230 [compost metagenome]